MSKEHLEALHNMNQDMRNRAHGILIENGEMTILDWVGELDNRITELEKKIK
ncbi:hypothetical protein KAX02_08090 [candidate division WOR-3 bacterium]|nr:hypothetical protein [candidate division WOR-3 bacterium]